ncbi:MAG: putative terminase large subunit [Prokaryotic dsDNA virus sp.]|nr:MAG: putative terminase large subunit [Prokaryotic dsDNA virus sp.]|tara:strand:- start:17120 stop:18697 length:1578 start_codon:yes stop_codon:yes gene_type:complete
MTHLNDQSGSGNHCNDPGALSGQVTPLQGRAILARDEQSRAIFMIHTPDMREIDRELSSRSLAGFVRRAWSQIIPDRLQWNWHIEAVCEHLEACATGDIKRLLVNVPPGTSKSTLIGVMYPAWLWGPAGQSNHRYIGAAHEQNLAIRDNRMMRELITSEWYQSIWPLGLKGDQNEKLYFENERRGFRQACAVKSMTGRRGHTIAWDDPLSPEKAHSVTERETAIRILSETVPTRLNDPARSNITVVMQRLHEGDPSGHIIASELGYDHLCIPMEFEPERRHYTSIGWTDPRTEPGELLDPVRFPPEVIERDKKAMGAYAWAGQMQQRPSPLGGGILKDEWWNYYDVLPRLTHRTIYADTAQKTKEQNDWSVFQCWGKIRETGQIVLIDQVRGKWEAPELLTQARAFWNKHKSYPGESRMIGALRAFKVEDKVSGTGLIQTLKREGIPMLAIQRDTDKITRALDAAPQIEAGNVMLPRNASFLSGLLAEASAFPNGVHDDQLDPMFDAISEMTTPGGAERMAALVT